MYAKKLIELARKRERGELTPQEFEIGKAEILHAHNAENVLPIAGKSVATDFVEKLRTLATTKAIFLTIPMLIRIALALLGSNWFLKDQYATSFLLELGAVLACALVLPVLVQKKTTTKLPYHAIAISCLALNTAGQGLILLYPRIALTAPIPMILVNIILNVYIIYILHFSEILARECPEYKRAISLPSLFDRVKSFLPLTRTKTETANEYVKDRSRNIHYRSINDVSESGKTNGDISIAPETERVDTRIYANSKYYGVGLSTIFVSGILALHALLIFNAKSEIDSTISEVKTEYTRHLQQAQNCYAQPEACNQMRLQIIERRDEVLSTLKNFWLYLMAALLLDLAMFAFLAFPQFRFGVSMAVIWLGAHLFSIWVVIRYGRLIGMNKKLPSAPWTTEEIRVIIIASVFYLSLISLMYLYFSISKRIQITFGQKLSLSKFNFSHGWLPLVQNIPRETLDRIAGVNLPKPPGEISDRLSELVKLKESGLITDEEYEDKKRKLIDSL